MSTSKVLLGVVVGLAAGAMAGILMAPDSGSNTRKKLSDRGQGMVDDLKGKFNDFLDGFMSHVETVKDDASDIADRAKNKIGETVKKVGNVSNYNS
jgi:gas vesicle protein